MATETTLRCGDYKCSRDERSSAIEFFVDSRDYAEKAADKPKAKARLKDLRCRFHVGVIKRSKYSQKDLLPLTDKDRARLRDEQAAVYAENMVKRDEQAAERERRDIQRHAAEWAFQTVEAHWAIDPDKDRATFGEEPTFEGSLWTGDRPERNWDSRWFNIEPSVRYYRAVNRHERKYPYVICVSRGSNLSPNEARALAAALIEGANKAEELNAARKPNL